jgi:hypothetical protein
MQSNENLIELLKSVAKEEPRDGRERHPNYDNFSIIHDAEIKFCRRILNKMGINWRKENAKEI